MATRYAVAEYCSGPFYMGWWLYERDRNEGSPNDDRWDHWGWLRDSDRWSKQHDLWRLCVGISPLAPEPERYTQRFAEWFAGAFPAGLLVEIQDDDHAEQRYRLIEMIREIPPQPPHVIRTIADAELSFARVCQEDKTK